MIVRISGRKQAGKNTIANYINGYVLKELNMVNDFYIDNTGSLVISTKDSNGNTGYGIFDVTRKDYAFVEYAERELWPYIKVYHFADYLKDICVKLFGLNPKNIYGTDSDKNEATPFIWKEMPGISQSDTNIRYQTHREFMEYFGTTIVRKIKQDAWVYATINKILEEKSKISIIPDVRFPNEVKAIKESGGIVIRLTRNLHDSKVECEAALDKSNYDWSQFDHVIDNDSCSIEELCDKTKVIISQWSI